MNDEEAVLRGNQVEWINFEKQQPKNSNRFLVCVEYEYGVRAVQIAAYVHTEATELQREGGFWALAENSHYSWRVTHWMPLPSLPYLG